MENQSGQEGCFNECISGFIAAGKWLKGYSGAGWAVRVYAQCGLTGIDGHGAAALGVEEDCGGATYVVGMFELEGVMISVVEPSDSFA